MEFYSWNWSLHDGDSLTPVYGSQFTTYELHAVNVADVLLYFSSDNLLLISWKTSFLIGVQNSSWVSDKVTDDVTPIASKAAHGDDNPS